MAGTFAKIDQAEIIEVARAEERSNKMDLSTFFRMELVTTTLTPDTEDLEDMLDVFVAAYASAQEEYDDPFERTLEKLEIVSLRSEARRLSDSRELQNINLFVDMRSGGFCIGCGSNPFFTNQIPLPDGDFGRRELITSSYSYTSSNDRKIGAPTEAELLARFSALLTSGDYGTIIDAVSLDEVLSLPSGKGKGKGKGRGGSKSSKKSYSRSKSGKGSSSSKKSGKTTSSSASSSKSGKGVLRRKKGHTSSKGSSR